MVYILLAALFLIAGVHFLLHGSLLVLIPVLILGIAAVVLRLLKKKLPHRISEIGWIACVAAIFVLFLLPVSSPAAPYGQMLSRAQDLLAGGEYDRALQTIGEMEAEYGEDDNTHCLKAIELLATGDCEKARAELNEMQDRSTRLYYSTMEKCLLFDEGQDHKEEICELYLEAAVTLPGWQEMQKNAGLVQMERENYKAAAYFLEEAVLLDPKDAETYYYLGVADYYLQNWEAAYACLNKAAEYGIDASYKEDLARYASSVEERLQ